MKEKNVQKKTVKFCFYTLNVSTDYINKIEQKYNINSRSSVVQARNEKKLREFKIFLSELNSTEYVIDISRTIELIQKGEIDSVDTSTNKIIDLDMNTLRLDDDYIFFQMVNNRDRDIPAKREIKGKKNEIKLKDTEYIGEFMSVLYHRRTNVFMIQCNRYSVTVNQLQKVLSEYFTSYCRILHGDIDPITLTLQPVLDPDQINKIDTKNFLETFTLSSSCASMAAINSSQNKSTNFLLKSLNSFCGYDFTLQIKASKHGKKGYTLNSADITDLVNRLNEFKNSGVAEKELPKLKVGIRENENSPREVIDWLVPSLHTNINFDIKSRTSLSDKEVYTAMKKSFDNLLGRIGLLRGIIDVT